MNGTLKDLFGPGTWGTGGNLVAWILCGLLAGLWLRAKLRAQAALARLHHQQATDQRQEHHDAAMAQAQEHHDATQQHITVTSGKATT